MNKTQCCPRYPQDLQIHAGTTSYKLECATVCWLMATRTPMSLVSHMLHGLHNNHSLQLFGTNAFPRPRSRPKSSHMRHWKSPRHVVAEPLSLVIRRQLCPRESTLRGVLQWHYMTSVEPYGNDRVQSFLQSIRISRRASC